jgi:hypothetical protein
MQPRALLPLLLLLPVLAWGHGTELIGGRVVPFQDGVAFEMELSAGRCAMLAGSDIAPATWGELRRLAPELCRQLALGLCRGEADLGHAPDRVLVPALTGDFPPDDALRLPDAILVRALWRQGTAQDRIGERFALPGRMVMLVVERPDGSVEAAPPSDPDAVPAAKTAAEPWQRTILTAIALGIAHIIPGGLDHVLFVLGLYLAARRPREVILQVTAFTAAHCLTLGLVMGGLVVMSSGWGRLVEFAIALSIVAVAIENCRRREAAIGIGRVALIAGFGLVHGLGFAGALNEVTWPEGRFLPALLAANAGIELGQLLVIGLAATCTAWFWSRTWYRPAVVIPASILIGSTGLFWSVQRALG